MVTFRSPMARATVSFVACFVQTQMAGNLFEKTDQGTGKVRGVFNRAECAEVGNVRAPLTLLCSSQPPPQKADVWRACVYHTPRAHAPHARKTGRYCHACVWRCCLLRQGLQSLGLRVSEDDMAEAMNSLGIPDTEDAQISKSQFLTMVKLNLQNREDTSSGEDVEVCHPPSL